MREKSILRRAEVVGALPEATRKVSVRIVKKSAGARIAAPQEPEELLLADTVAINSRVSGFEDQESSDDLDPDASFKALDGLVYPPVGACIYCGATHDLTNEHILPFGLSGTAVLPKSSCRTCAGITGSVEQTVLRGSMWPVRVARDLRSRSKHKDAPAAYPVLVLRQGIEVELELPIEDYPILLPFPIFAPPAFFDPEGYISGIRTSGLTTISFGPTPDETARRLGADSVKITVECPPVAFARMLAKVAYAWAAAENRLDRLAGTSYVVPAIRGIADDIGKWVGTITDTSPVRKEHLHRILVHEDKARKLLIGEVQLFSDSETPRYGVILGSLKS